MELLKKKILEELDALIDQAPDIDMESAYNNFRETHLKVLTDKNLSIEGLSTRLILITDILRFQHFFLRNCNISNILQDVLLTAQALDQKNVLKNFFDQNRMKQMFYILEKKMVSEKCVNLSQDKE